MIMIGELAKHAQCTVPTVHYYESIGLLPFAAQREAIKTRIKAQEDLDFNLSLYVGDRHSGGLQNDTPCNIYQDMATS